MISYPISVPRSPCNKSSATTTDISCFFKRPLARRALTELGPNDPKLNMKMAESLLTISGAEFIKKWNFDPIREKPLPPGRYLWTAVKQHRRLARETAAAGTTSVPAEVVGLGAAPELDATVLSLPRASSPMMTAEVVDLDMYGSYNDRLSPIPRDVSPVGECHPRLHEELVVDVVRDVAIAAVATALHRTPKKSRHSSHNSHSPRTKQCKITAFGRERKRVLSNSKSEESDVEVTPTKKPNTGKPKTPRKK